MLISLAASQTLEPGDAERTLAAIKFFKPVRSWLDTLVFVAEPLADPAPVPNDYTGTVDGAPAPTDYVAAPATPLTDTYAITPYYSAHYYHTGYFKMPAAQPGPVDSGVVANGVAISGNFSGSAP